VHFARRRDDEFTGWIDPDLADRGDRMIATLQEIQAHPKKESGTGRAVIARLQGASKNFGEVQALRQVNLPSAPANWSRCWDRRSGPTRIELNPLGSADRIFAHLPGCGSTRIPTRRRKDVWLNHTSEVIRKGETV